MQRKEKEKNETNERTNEMNAAKKRNYVIEKLKRRKKSSITKFQRTIYPYIKTFGFMVFHAFVRFLFLIYLLEVCD